MSNEFANMPISNSIYGDDHPLKRPQRGDRVVIHEPREHGTRIIDLLDQRVLKKIARKYPRLKRRIARAGQSACLNEFYECGGNHA